MKPVLPDTLSIAPGKTTPPLGTLWLGPRLPRMETMCMLNMVRAGWDVTLFGYQRPENLPSDIPFRDAREVMERDLSDRAVEGARALPGAMAADIFRLHMIRQENMAWVDSDFLPVSDRFPDIRRSFFAVNDNLPANTTMYFAPDDPVLLDYIAAVEDEFPEPQPFYGAQVNARIRELRRTDTPMHRGQMHARRYSGPFVLRHLLQIHNRTGEALAEDVIFPIQYSNKSQFWDPYEVATRAFSERTWAVHLWGSRIRGQMEEREADPGSFLGYFLAEVGMGKPQAKRGVA
ncbi:hypothetical protein KBY24_12050 [Ruegeria pomeroyi]|uniref:Alpha 1,4-glycosyltransferase conserved region n=1 Tax=Ruegeria alba TaxID=2916756 RepID=A0ABS9NU32_9RHOB|nr:hypothetical protein [Ruegeria alba]MCE8526130.1 hypothetical protein [Ruegeria pomeroyi]MCE8534119.1 hypothetical protein [Ruegeria pomeroyi]MCE8545610.1 hypothetical protein [Ruegeria pomeroyi]MCG6557727.1 hypothetical protein [Ruegeria alba]